MSGNGHTFRGVTVIAQDMHVPAFCEGKADGTLDDEIELSLCSGKKGSLGQILAARIKSIPRV